MNLKRGNEAFAAAREIYRECADILDARDPLSSYAFSSASFIIHSILESFKENGIIPSYDNDAIFNYLYARQPVILALGRLKDLMQQNSQEQVWDTFGNFAYTQFDDYAVICGVLPIDSNLFDFCALPIPKEYLIPFIEKSCAMSYLRRYQSIACVLEPRESEEHCRRAMQEFIKSTWHPAFENIDEIRAQPSSAANGGDE